MKVRITRTQHEILDHRLSIPDCIAEVLNENARVAGTELVSEDDVESSACDLTKMSERGVIDWGALSDLDKLVLWDSIDGSTFMGCADGAVGTYITPQKYQGYSRSFENLVDKLEAVGMPTIHCGFI